MIAVYPGSFDPVTSGHFDIIRRSSDLFESVVVLVAPNSDKSPMFTVSERVHMLSVACTGLNNVSIDTLPNGLLVNHVTMVHARVIIKGLRAVSDFEYEFQMALLNKRLAPEIETVFLMASAEHSFLSSSIVKEIGRLGGDFTGLVPPSVVETLTRKFEMIATGNVPAGE